MFALQFTGAVAVTCDPVRPVPYYIRSFCHGRSMNSILYVIKKYVILFHINY